MNLKKFGALAKAGEVALAVITSIIFSAGSDAQTFSPYSDFQNLSQSDTQTLQIKLTFVGPRKDTVPGLAFTPGTLDLTKFLPFRRSVASYPSDTGVESFTATTTEMKAVLNGVGTLPSVTSGAVGAQQWLSYAMVWTSGSTTKGFEAIVGKADAAAVFAQLRTAFANNKPGLKVLSDMACPIGATDPTVATDVSAKTSVSFSGIRLNRTSGYFTGTATVKNTTASAIAGPISLVLGLPGDMTLATLDGTTCSIKPVGQPFVTLALTNNSLSGGASVQVTLQIVNPASLPITPTSKVVAGTGSR